MPPANISILKPVLNVVEAGNPEGPPALFVHGFMSSNLQWELNLQRLGSVLRMVIVEHPGHGESPVPEDPSGYAPEAVLPAIDHVREQLGIDQWWVVGHSMGGAICARYALAHPDRTNGLIFTNSRAMFGFKREDNAARRRDVAQPNSVEDLRALPFHPIHAKRFPPDLQQRLVDVADAMNPRVITDLGRSAGRWRSGHELHTLSVPVLLVNGKWESAFQPNVEDARQSITDLRIVDLEGGHSINIEQAQAFDEAVLDFVANRTKPSDIG